MAEPTPADRTRLQPVPLIPSTERAQFGGSLPVSLTSFVGRSHEIAQVCALLNGETRLVTLIGPGGVGKTRLALAVAAAAGPGFPDGTVFVGLAALADPALVLPAIGQALGVRESGDRPLGERLGALLGGRRLLLVLDNLEHLVEAAPQVAELLGACPGMTILATSRVVLRLSGEQVYRVSPLAVPDATRSPAPAHVAEHGAVALFVQRAHAADPEFALTPENAAAVVEIVRRLDGLPLAIELAAARVPTLPPAALLARLTRCPKGGGPDRLSLLTRGARDLPTRQRTIRDTIAWSYDLLTPAEQAFFRRLAVFAGGFTLEAAEAVAGDIARGRGDKANDPSASVPTPSTLDLIGSLVDQSLLRREVGPGDVHRYHMLETIREYAFERLDASGEEAASRQRHADYYFAVVEDVTPTPPWPATAARTRLIGAERDNLRAALAWLEKVGNIERYLRLAAPLWPLWFTLGNVEEGRRCMELGVARGGDVPVGLLALATGHLGRLSGIRGDGVRALQLLEQALRLADMVENPTFTNRFDATMMLLQMGAELVSMARYEEAEAYLARALAEYRKLGHQANAARALSFLGSAAMGRGDLAAAQTRGAESLALAREAYSPLYASTAAAMLGRLACVRGDHAGAATAFRDAIALGEEAQDHIGQPVLLASVAMLAVGRDAPEVATRLLGAAEVLALRLGTPHQLPDRTFYEQTAATARAALGDRFAAAWAEGELLTPVAAIAEAGAYLATVDRAPMATAATHPAGAAGLTPREGEVLRLVAEGRSNREIAEALFVSESTAITHVRHILTKLGLDSRTAVAAWAIRHGLG